MLCLPLHYFPVWLPPAHTGHRSTYRRNGEGDAGFILVQPAPAFPGRVYDIRSPGATGDGGTDTTIFARKAIDSGAVGHGTTPLQSVADKKSPAFFLPDTEDFSLESDDIISANWHMPLVMVSESREPA